VLPPRSPFRSPSRTRKCRYVRATYGPERRSGASFCTATVSADRQCGVLASQTHLPRSARRSVRRRWRRRTPNPNQAIAPTSAITRHSSQSGHVELQNWFLYSGQNPVRGSNWAGSCLLASLISRRYPSGSRKKHRTSSSYFHGWRQKLRPPLLEHLASRCAVRHADCHLVAYRSRNRWREDDVGLVLGGRSARHEEQPSPEEAEDYRGPALLALHLGTQNVLVEQRVSGRGSSRRADA
jgi:hypothetical protein